MWMIIELVSCFHLTEAIKYKSTPASVVTLSKKDDIKITFLDAYSWAKANWKERFAIDVQIGVAYAVTESVHTSPQDGILGLSPGSGVDKCVL